MTNTNQQEQLYRWVEASDRLPEKEKVVLVNHNGHYHKAYYRDKWFVAGTNVVYAYEHQNLQIEWLEPYTPPVEDGKLGGEVWETGFTITNHNTAKWTKAQIDKNNETENRMVFENFHVSDMGRSRRLICTCETKEQASEVVEKYNAALKSQPSTPVQDGWVRVEDYNNEQGRLLVFSPVYKETDPMRYRVIDSQFLSTCKDVTHYHLPSPPPTNNLCNMGKFGIFVYRFPGEVVADWKLF